MSQATKTATSTTLLPDGSVNCVCNFSHPLYNLESVSSMTVELFGDGAVPTTEANVYACSNPSEASSSNYVGQMGYDVHGSVVVTLDDNAASRLKNKSSVVVVFQLETIGENAIEIDITYAINESKYVGYYNGSSFDACSVHYYDGTQFVSCQPYYYDGTQWKLCAQY